jgi:cell division protein FtsW
MPRRKARRKKVRSVQRKKMDYLLLSLATVLTLFGVLMVYDASVVEAYRDFSDKYYFAKQQLVWAGLGLILMIIVSYIPYSAFRKLSVWAFGGTVILLFLVLIPSIGTKALGARRWINLGGFNIQPAELTKLTLVVYLASLFEKKKPFLQFALIITAVIGLIMLEPDLGTATVVAGISVAVYFFSGASLTKLFTVLLASLLAGIGFIATSEYRKTRVLTFLNPSIDPLGASYHIRQVLIALGSGGLFGVGIGRSRQKYEYIPAATTDSIFAIVAEELGFFGAAVLIALFAVLFIRSFQIAKKAPDNFSKLLSGGVSSWIAIQTVINLATMVALVPLTGIPLPLISYGGSATVMSLIGIGMLLSVSRYEKKG